MVWLPVSAAELVCHHVRVTTVLIVDDHPSFRASARAMLEADGFDVIGEAEDGECAIAAADGRSPTSSCSTSSFPDIDGFEVSRRLR